MNSIKNIPVGKIQAHPENPRKKMSAEELEELAQSIKSIGLLQPITVRRKFELVEGAPVGEKYYQIVCGHRRFEAAKLAGLEEVPCIVRELTDEEAYEIMITENLQRKDVDPFEEASAFQALHKRGYDTESLADKFGKSRSYIYTRLKLQNLIPGFEEMYEKGEVEFSHCAVLAKLEKPFQEKMLKDRYSGGYNCLSGRPVSELKYAITSAGKPIASAPFDKKACEGCPKNTSCASLFLDLSSAVCEDAECYDKKYVDYAVSELDAVRKMNPEFFIVDESYKPSGVDVLILEELRRRGFKFEKCTNYYNSERVDRDGFHCEDKNVRGFCFSHYDRFFGPERRIEPSYVSKPRKNDWSLDRYAEEREEKEKAYAREVAAERLCNMTDDEWREHKNGYSMVFEAMLEHLVAYGPESASIFGLKGDMDKTKAADIIEKMEASEMMAAIVFFIAAKDDLEYDDTRFIEKIIPEAFEGVEAEGKKRYMDACRACWYGYDEVTDEMVEADLAERIKKNEAEADEYEAQVEAEMEEDE